MTLKILSKDDLVHKIGIVVGTRPGIIKFSPVIRALKQKNADFFIIHTGQHYSHNMDRYFFEELNLPQPKHVNPDTKNYKYHGEQTAEMIKSVERACLIEKPNLVIVGGDANTNLAAGLAVRKLGITLAHLEAGLRSYDWSMPEEHNRVILDHISEILLAPTMMAKENLVKDNVQGKIYVTGNTIVDSVKQNAEIAEKRKNTLKNLGIEPGKYFLLTYHREENVDNEARIKEFINTIENVAERFGFPVIFPMHPRTVKRLSHFNLYDKANGIDGLNLIDPLGYLDFLNVMKNSRMILTDSGGIQEEACILDVPCVTLRENTERPETTEIGANILAGNNLERVAGAIDYFLESKTYTWKQPYGEDPGKKVADVLLSYVNDDCKKS